MYRNSGLILRKYSGMFKNKCEKYNKPIFWGKKIVENFLE